MYSHFSNYCMCSIHKKHNWKNPHPSLIDDTVSGYRIMGHFKVSFLFSFVCILSGP